MQIRQSQGQRKEKLVRKATEQEEKKNYKKEARQEREDMER
jgi:hypothetical protein